MVSLCALPLVVLLLLLLLLSCAHWTIHTRVRPTYVFADNTCALKIYLHFIFRLCFEQMQMRLRP